MGDRLKFIGWGKESAGLDDAERDRLFRFLASRLGIEPQLVAPPRLTDISLRPPRLMAPGTIGHMFTADPYRAVPAHLWKVLSRDCSCL